MSNETKKTALPKLRFPEFEDAPEWENKKVNELTTSVTPPKKLKTPDYLKEGLFQRIDQSQCFICGWTDDKAALVTPNFPLIIFGDHTCALKIANFPFAQGADGIKILKSSQLIEPSFLYQYLLFNPVKQEEYKRHFSILKEKIVCYPKKETGEQQKIADALSSLDDLITAQSDKLVALQEHKRGLMQGLFPAEGETVPKLRFPEFQDSEEWQGYPLKDVFTIFQGFAFSSNDSASEGIRWLKIADVGIQRMSLDAPSFLPISYKESYKRYLVLEGDYVMALTRPILGDELKIAPVDKDFDGALLNQRVGKLVTPNNITFIYYLLQTAKLISNIKKSIAGSEPPNLSTYQIEEIATLIPNKSEQQKIADCLSSLDDRITAQSQKVEVLKIYKKGLMQGLFPSLEAND